MQNINVQWYDIFSMIGVGIILITYFLLQYEKLEARSYAYSLLNIIGAAMILYSLFYDWNLSAVVIESFWIIISFIGLIKHFLHNRKR